jgi:Effector Associated Constant Component 1
MARQATLEIQLDVDESDPQELAELTARLRRELLRLDVDSVDQPVAGEAPEGTKAVDLMVIGSLIVNLGRSAGALTSVVRAVQGWLGSSASRTVKLQLDGDSIELSGVKSSDQQRLIDLWIERHAVAT